MQIILKTKSTKTILMVIYYLLLHSTVLDVIYATTLITPTRYYPEKHLNIT